MGAVDGKRMIQQTLIKSSNLYNFKSSVCIALFATVDADYGFLFGDVDC
jgi:hypothetical protein